MLRLFFKARRLLPTRARESDVFVRRTWFAALGMVALMCALIGRLVFLQLINHDHYTTLSQENRLKIIAIPPTRGLIYSRDGVLLADNRPSFALEVVPEQVNDLERSIASIRQFVPFDDDQLERFRDALKQKRPFDVVTVKENLSQEEVAIFAVNRHRFPGFDIAGRLSRYYPLGAQTAHVVGFVGRINVDELNRIDPGNYRGTTHIGKEGVEKSREEILHGTAGYQQVEVNAQGRVLRVVESVRPQPGHDLHLSIDSHLQARAIKALEGQRGAIIAIEPATGAVLAFVSNPSFDPNEFVNGISKKLYSELRDSPDRPLFNRALQGLYPPGSTVKPAMALGGLEFGLRVPATQSYCPGWFRLPKQAHKYRCWQKVGHGSVNMVRAIAESCDVYFYELARDMGIDKMHEILSQFGLGELTGIDLPGELMGLLPSREWKQRTRKMPWFPGETLINGIGQGFTLSTPLQLAQMASVFANRGEVQVPHVVGTIEDPLTGQSEVIQAYQRPSVHISQTTNWDEVIAGMHEVVQGQRGTAKESGKNASYQYAGKTGTAQLFGIAQDRTVKNKDVVKHLRDHALFMAFAPMENPVLALGIVVENGESGAHTAAPIARELFDFYFSTQEPASDASG